MTRTAADVLADLAALAARQAELTAELAHALRAPAPAPLSAPAGASSQPEYLSPREAAALLGVSLRGLENLRRAGRGPAFVRVGRAVRYPRAALAAQNAVQFPSTAGSAVPSSAAK